MNWSLGIVLDTTQATCRVRLTSPGPPGAQHPRMAAPPWTVEAKRDADKAARALLQAFGYDTTTLWRCAEGAELVYRVRLPDTYEQV